MSSSAHKVLKKLAHSDKILMGYSAGTLLFGPNLELFDSVDSILGFNEIELKKLECLGFYQFLIFPHFTDFTSEFPGLSDEIKSFESKSNYRVIRLNDDQGISYKKGIVKMIGS